MKKIMVIEDNLEVRENLCEILELSGYETISAENGKIGVEKIRKEAPDLIICDVMMPELDGFGVLKILNRDPNLMDIPFMFLTAKAEKSDFRKGMGLGADDYITKPFDDVELLDAIELRLKKSERLQRIDNSEQGLRTFFDEAKATEQLNKLSEDRESRTYKPKSVIYEHGQYPTWLYYVVSGQIKCSQINSLGKELITNVYGPGEFFGFLPLLTDGKYEDSATALKESVIKLIPKNDFTLLLFNDRDFSAKFIKMLASHANHSESQLVELAYSSVRKKVANALLQLAHKSNDNAIQIRRDDLANLAGTAKETVIRTVTDFKSEGLLEVTNNAIVLLEIEKLKDLPQ